jgi:hypothetical protein
MSAHIHIKKIAWDAWEAWCDDRPLIRSIKPSAKETLEDMLTKLGEGVQKPLQTAPSVDVMIEQLLAAGWAKKSSAVWISPKGCLFRGPFGAWKVMRSVDGSAQG